MLAINSDIYSADAAPEEVIGAIAAGGFSRIHWCQQWSSDLLYLPVEIRAIQRLFNRHGVHVNGVHASCGRLRFCWSPTEWVRDAGFELVVNRMEFAAELGGDSVVLHAPTHPENRAEWEVVLRVLDRLEAVSRRLGVRVAVENMPLDANAGLEELWRRYSPEFLGFCYDSGHGNLGDFGGLDFLERNLDRLTILHLNDNDGHTGDQHLLPGDGSADWPRLAALLAKSPCRDNVNIEVAMRGYEGVSVADYLARALAAARRVEALIAAAC